LRQFHQWVLRKGDIINPLGNNDRGNTGVAGIDTCVGRGGGFPVERVSRRRVQALVRTHRLPHTPRPRSLRTAAASALTLLRARSCEHNLRSHLNPIYPILFFCGFLSLAFTALPCFAMCCFARRPVQPTGSLMLVAKRLNDIETHEDERGLTVFTQQ